MIHMHDSETSTKIDKQVKVLRKSLESQLLIDFVCPSTGRLVLILV